MLFESMPTHQTELQFGKVIFHSLLNYFLKDKGARPSVLTHWDRFSFCISRGGSYS